jgi:hypothetical protein
MKAEGNYSSKLFQKFGILLNKRGTAMVGKNLGKTVNLKTNKSF